MPRPSSWRRSRLSAVGSRGCDVIDVRLLLPFAIFGFWATCTFVLVVIGRTFPPLAPKTLASKLFAPAFLLSLCFKGFRDSYTEAVWKVFLREVATPVGRQRQEHVAFLGQWVASLLLLFGEISTADLVRVVLHNPRMDARLRWLLGTQGGLLDLAATELEPEVRGQIYEAAEAIATRHTALVLSPEDLARSTASVHAESLLLDILAASGTTALNVWDVAAILLHSRDFLRVGEVVEKLPMFQICAIGMLCDASEEELDRVLAELAAQGVS